MRDRQPPNRRNFLRHTAGPYIRVNLRHERFVPTGPLSPNLPPLLTHSQAAAGRQERTLQKGLAMIFR
jgi:hypothetical protein